MKKKLLVFVFILALILGVGFLSLTVAADPIEVSFPSPVGNLLGTLPVKVVISDPKCFGYPRIPVEISISLAGYQQHKLEIPLLEEVYLKDPMSLKRFLDTPIEKSVDFPLPVHEIGVYHLLVDVKCLYGPSYSRSYWYSFTSNKELEIEPERVHIVGGQIENGKGKFYGYSLSQAAVYDFLEKGQSGRIQVEVVNLVGEVLYTEEAGALLTFFDPPTPKQIQIELEETEKSYQFLLDRYPTAQLRVSWVQMGTGDRRWLFSVQSLEWVAEHGIVIEAPFTGLPFAGLNEIMWLGWRWNPQGEFQLEED